MIQVVMLDVLVPHFDRWLAFRGLQRFRIPLDEPPVGESRIETYGITPTDATVKLAADAEEARKRGR